MGRALWLRWLWLSRTDPARSWATLPVNEDATTMAFFKASIRCTAGNGHSTSFWTDPWLNGRCLADVAPDLFQAVAPWARKRSVFHALTDGAWIHDIVDALSIAVLGQYLLLQQRLDSVHLEPVVEDQVAWRWSASGSYSASSAYGAMFYGSSELLGARQLWKVCAPGEHKFFGWLVCWTAEWRHRHGLQDDDKCALCNQGSESIGHLLLGCVYSREVWMLLLQPQGWE
jgi:hypothetical protein